ncbi:MAG: 50S ribosomal protein L24 [Dethiobacter sp.]|jgi:large subunit ribosomal protein L24|nr:50S ribosomal protein L24 [Dethiobacter sp.]
MTVSKLHVRKGDKVLVLSGKDKGKKGKILSAEPSKGTVVVEGVNIVKKHTRASQRVQAGIHEHPAPLNCAKVMVVCPNCQKATRIKKEAQKDGTRIRACKKCGESLDK